MMHSSATTRLVLPRMIARDPNEPHRVASALELFFDLVFVVAVAFASGQLHHALTEAHVWEGIGAYFMVLFAIWWAWMNFTWFASAFDTDDWLYRVLTIAQMAGALVLAAGTTSAMASGDFALVTLGYVLMRIAMVVQWIRVAVSVPEMRTTALTYVLGIMLVQIAWTARLVLPEQGGVWTFLALAACELLVPVIAERRVATPWHADHIAERYSLFTLILLGESILASTTAVVNAIDASIQLSALLTTAICGIILAAGMWWTYFSGDHAKQLTSQTNALRFGYGHYVIFAAAGAFSAGVGADVDFASGTSKLSEVAAASVLTVPVALFLIGIWLLTLRHGLSPKRNVAYVVLALALAASALVPFALPVAAGCMVLIVIVVESARTSTTNADVAL